MEDDPKDKDQSTPPAVKASKITKEVFAAVKAAILELNPKSKDHQKVVASLDIDDCEILSKKGSTYVVEAGNFGVRKVTL
jgi:hypothetical protein